MRPWVTAEDLRARLLQGPTATAALRALYGGPVRIRRLAGGGAGGAGLMARLELGPGEAVAHRRVLLLAAGQAVSEAEIWYVPGRLGPGMAETLRATDLPFGEVVAPLRPRREMVETRDACAQEFAAGNTAHATCILQVHAVVRVENGLVIAVVRERYLRVEDGAAGLP